MQKNLESRKQLSLNKRFLKNSEQNGQDEDLQLMKAPDLGNLKGKL